MIALSEIGYDPKLKSTGQFCCESLRPAGRRTRQRQATISGLVVRDAARPSLLDSYAVERGMADRHVLEVSDEVHTLVMSLIAMCDRGELAVPPPDPTRDMAAARRRSMLDISYAGSALVGQAGAGCDGFSSGMRFPACSSLSGTRHHLIVFDGAPRLDRLRARWDKLVSIVDGSTVPFVASAADFPKSGAILVRADGFVGFRADPADETTMDALYAHLMTYLIPHVGATYSRPVATADARV